jgi:hypothetical protein
MMKLRLLVEENQRMAQLRKTIDDLFQLWRNMPEGERKEKMKNRIDAIGRKFDRVRNADPYEGDKHAFMKHHYTGHISSDAYRNYEKEGGLGWLGTKEKYPKVIATGKYGNFDVEFRQSGEKLKYYKRSGDDYARDEKGELVPMSPEEIRAENLPEECTSVVAFVGDKPVGFASNEFGAVGVWVEGPYQKSGIGTELMDLHIQQRLTFKTKKGKIGQMTISGQSMTAKYYDKMVKRHGLGWFKKLKMSEAMLKEIMSPHAKPSLSDKKRGYVGCLLGSRIIAYDDMVPDVLQVDHSELPGGRRGARWRWFAETPKNTVLWNEFPPSHYEKEMVEEWLRNKGINNPNHISYREYVYMTTGKWEEQITEMHDYHHSMDYDEDFRPPPKVKEAVDGILKQTKQLQDALGLKSVRIGYIVRDDGDALARYINGSMDNPYFVISGRTLLKAAKKYGLNLWTAVETTLVHEFGHAYLEMCGIDTSDHDEDVVEEFAREYDDFHDIIDAKKVLDDFIETQNKDIRENNDVAWKKDWLERHRAKLDDKGRIIAYHGTPTRNLPSIRKNGFRPRSYFTLRPEYAKSIATTYHDTDKVTVIEVHLPVDAVDMVMSDIYALRNITFGETQ